jgi:hypothetical protein
MTSCQNRLISPEPLLAALLRIFCFTCMAGRTSLEKASTDLAANPAELTEKDFSEFIGPAFQRGPFSIFQVHDA